MLVTLKIRNFALVDNLEWTPGEGFNAVTGETGAGKSILIGALNLAVGGRAEKKIIRHGEDSASVEAVFQPNKNHLKKHIVRILEEAGIDSSEEDDSILILKRTINSSGTVRQWINGCATSLQTLRAVGDLLVDFHGPHDHQALFSANTQRNLLDAFAKAFQQREAVFKAWRQKQEAEKFYESLKKELETGQERVERLREQVLEIERAQLRPGEDEEISHLLAVASQSSRLAEICRRMICEIEEDQQSIESRLSAVRRLARELGQLDTSNSVQLITAAVDSLQKTLQELQELVFRYAQKIDFDPQTLELTTQRDNVIQFLKKKYGPRLQDVLEFHRLSLAEIERYENRDFELAEAEIKKEAAIKAYHQAANRLSEMRTQSASALAENITKELHDLNFRQAEFQVSLIRRDAGMYGIEEVDFLFRPNPGEGMRPLRAIASSGEMARVMLAIKTCLAAQDETPLLVFDEVDSNIGGETAIKVGQRLRHIGRNHQVLCITHLPQVAAAANIHFVVEKDTSEGRTKTHIRKIQNAERVSEIVRMFGGSVDAIPLAQKMLNTEEKAC